MLLSSSRKCALTAAFKLPPYSYLPIKALNEYNFNICTSMTNQCRTISTQNQNDYVSKSITLKLQDMIAFELTRYPRTQIKTLYSTICIIFRKETG